VGTGKQGASHSWASVAAILGVCLLVTVGVSCRAPHPSTPRAEPNLDPGWPRGNPFFTQVSYQQVKSVLPVVPGAEYVNDDELCVNCHGPYAKLFSENVHRGGTCESCHGPASRHLETRGKEPGLIFSFKSGDPAARAEACLRCHEENNCAEGARWRTSKHANCRVTCVDCHRGHYNVPPGTPATTEPGETAMQRAPLPESMAGLVTMTAFQGTANGKAVLGQGYVPPKQNLPSLRGTSNHLGAVAPGICYRCHGDKADLQQIAGPHQICGPNGFNCTTCHDPHGRIKEYGRKDLCLTCHTGAPTMAWHSSIHEHNGVACTDCHNPHPRACVPQIVNISHTNITRPRRLAMSVQEPEACYKCHPKIYGLNALPSHHPIKEGKMVCSDCHDPHGQETRNLKEATINLLCYKCHAEKQGPFAFEHPPVRENCAICHEPHGTVANNLLRQPATFLCLRCHPGHNAVHGPGSQLSAYKTAAGGTGILLNPAANNSDLHRGFYTDCSQCHAQIHGSDRISQGSKGDFVR
jgi:DmsE family decaheme c-type cytochrome